MEQPTTVLVVDDEPNMRVTLAAILEQEGYGVTIAATGEDAVEQTSKNRYDVVLMDVRMPGLGGLEAFRAMRRLQPAVRVLMMSAYSMPEVEQKALEEGVVVFLSKPLDIPELINTLRADHDSGTRAVMELDVAVSSGPKDAEAASS